MDRAATGAVPDPQQRNATPRRRERHAGEPVHLLVPRESFYGREDKTLGDRLATELPGIVNWPLAGWDRFTERGHFKQPISSASAL
jgi:phage/plasmid-associated DNA primase